MNATLYYHVRNQKDLEIRIVAKPPTSDFDSPYFEFHIGDVVMFIDDSDRQRLIQVLADAPPLPKSDAQIDAERESTGFAPTMGDTEVFRG